MIDFIGPVVFGSFRLKNLPPHPCWRRDLIRTLQWIMFTVQHACKHTHTPSSSGKPRFYAHLKIQVQDKSKSCCVITNHAGWKCCCEQFVRWSVHLGANKVRGSTSLGCSFRGYGYNKGLWWLKWRSHWGTRIRTHTQQFLYSLTMTVLDMNNVAVCKVWFLFLKFNVESIL